MFKVGDNIFYPLHGAGTIESIEDHRVTKLSVIVNEIEEDDEDEDE